MRFEWRWALMDMVSPKPAAGIGDSRMRCRCVLQLTADDFPLAAAPVATLRPGADMKQWILYVDESGLFDEPGQPGISFVGGVLLEVSERTADLAVLKRGVQECFPFLPWPLHATIARQASAHVVGSMIGSVQAPPWMKPLQQLVEKPTTESLSALREAVKRGVMPRQAVLVTAGNDLRREAPASMSHLQDAVDHGMRLIAHRLRHVSVALGDAVVISGAAVESGTGYAAALTSCIRSALRLIRSKTQPQPSLRLTVASRGKPDGELLDDDDVMDCAAAALIDAYPFASAMRPDVAVSSDHTKPMGTDTSPWLVVADYVCNRLFSRLGQQVALERVEQNASEVIGIPLRARPDWFSKRLPTVDFSGGTSFPWATQQRTEWDLARRGL